MNTRNLMCSFVVAGFAWLTLPSHAIAAEGVVVDPSTLQQADRASLLAQIANAKAQDPSAFTRLASVRADMTRLDANKRGRYVPVAKILRPAGASALLPMLEQLAFDAPARGTMTDSAWTAWRAGLIEAVGTLRDKRSAPVLLSILQHHRSDPMVLRAAAAAYGKLGTDDVAQQLVSLSRTTGSHRTAILAGMGHCRRVVVVSELSRVMSSHPDAQTAEVVAHSLGDIGSAWAWETPSLASHPERSATRALAAQALLNAYVTYEGAVREMATKALMVVNDPSTSSLIAEARAVASPALAHALDALAERMKNNPIR